MGMLTQSANIARKRDCFMKKVCLHIKINKQKIYAFFFKRMINNVVFHMYIGPIQTKISGNQLLWPQSKVYDSDGSAVKRWSGILHFYFNQDT